MIKRLFIITSIFSFLIISLSVTYYFVVFLPKNNQEKLKQQQLAKEQENQEKCREIGTKIYKDDLKDYRNYVVYEPKYKFSRKLNTCLYSGGYSTQVGSALENDWERWVKDSFTNEKIISVLYLHDLHKNNEGKIKQIEEFWKKNEELFNE